MAPTSRQRHSTATPTSQRHTMPCAWLRYDMAVPTEVQCCYTGVTPLPNHCHTNQRRASIAPAGPLRTGITPAYSQQCASIAPTCHQHRTCMTTMWHNVTPALHLLCSCRIRATPQFRQSLALCLNRTSIFFILFSSVGSEHHTIGTVSQRLGLDCALTRFWQHSDSAGTVLLYRHQTCIRQLSHQLCCFAPPSHQRLNVLSIALA